MLLKIHKNVIYVGIEHIEIVVYPYLTTGRQLKNLLMAGNTLLQTSRWPQVRMCGSLG